MWRSLFGLLKGKEDEEDTQESVPKQRIVLTDAFEQVPSVLKCCVTHTFPTSIIESWGFSIHLSVASTCKQFFLLLSPIIESSYFFHVYNEGYQVYNPQRLFIHSPNYNWQPFKHVTHITFLDPFNSTIENLPLSLTHLSFNNKFNQSVDNILPPSLTHVHFGRSFNHPFHPPPFLKSITYGQQYKHEFILPPSLSHLTIHSEYSPPIISVPPSVVYFSLSTYKSWRQNFSISTFPSFVTKLDLGFAFYAPIDNNSLPSTLTQLRFGKSFNHPIDNLLPSSLTELSLGENFNHPINNLPCSLISLELRKEFNHPIVSLPPNLKQLTFHVQSKYNHPLLCLPNSLTHLEFVYSAHFNEAIIFPLSLHTLRTSKDFRRGDRFPILPSNLKSLIIEAENDHPFDLHLPDSLTYLKTNGRFIQQLTKFPTSLKKLILDTRVAGPMETLPANCLLTILSYNSVGILNQLPHHQIEYLSCTALQFPDSLQHFSKLTTLFLPFVFDSVLPHLPDSLTTLHLGNKYNLPLSHLPPSLKFLYCGSTFNQNVNNLPNSLHTLTLGGHFNQPLDMLPSSLRILNLFNQGYKKKLNKLPLSIISLRIKVSKSSYKTIPSALHPVIEPP